MAFSLRGGRAGFGAALALVLAWSGTLAAQERFRLELPEDPTQSSVAVLTGDVLEIVDVAGKRTVYRASPQLDSADGLTIGFFSNAARQAIRWPVAGSGGFEIGVSGGVDFRWRRSRMIIVPERPAPPPLVNPVAPPPPQGFPQPRQPAPPGPAAGVVHLAALDLADAIQVAWIDAAGTLVLMQGFRDQWDAIPTRLNIALPPGAPLALLDDTADTAPLVYTCDENGRLLEIVGAAQVRVCGAEGAGQVPVFAPGARLAVCRDNRGSYVVACAADGRLWSYRVSEEKFDIVESRRGILTPGLPVGVAQGSSLAEVLVADKRGEVQGYLIEDGVWNAPRQIGAGFPPGGQVTGDVAEGNRPGSQLPVVAAIDANGSLQAGRVPPDEVWNRVAFDRAQLPPEAPIAMQQVSGVIRVGVVTPAARLAALQLVGDQWTAATVAEGIAPGAPVVLCRQGPTAFSVDQAGHVVAATLAGGRWRLHTFDDNLLGAPAVAGAAPVPPQGPRLLRRTSRPAPPLEPVTIELVNSQRDELVVKWVDLKDPRRPREISIKPGRSAMQRVERDAGGEIEEVFLVPDGAGGTIEDVRIRTIPPQARYEAAVFVNKVVSQYFDRTQNKTAVPDEVGRALTGVGTFQLPAGNGLQEADTLDVFQEAARQKNPGDAARFGP